MAENDSSCWQQHQQRNSIANNSYTTATKTLNNEPDTASTSEAAVNFCSSNRYEDGNFSNKPSATTVSMLTSNTKFDASPNVEKRRVFRIIRPLSLTSATAATTTLMSTPTINTISNGTTSTSCSSTRNNTTNYPILLQHQHQQVSSNGWQDSATNNSDTNETSDEYIFLLNSVNQLSIGGLNTNVSSCAQSFGISNTTPTVTSHSSCVSSSTSNTTMLMKSLVEKSSSGSSMRSSCQDSCYESDCHSDVSRNVSSASETLILEAESPFSCSNPLFSCFGAGPPDMATPRVAVPSSQHTVPAQVTALLQNHQELNSLYENPAYLNLLDFVLKLGYSEPQLRNVLQKLVLADLPAPGPPLALGSDSPMPSQDKVLAELIKLGQDMMRTTAKNSTNNSFTGGGESRQSTSPRRQPLVSPNWSLNDHNVQQQQQQPRSIVIDGSNVALMHGHKKVFSCLGLRDCVDWFKRRGHSDIKVFVPQFRKEESRADAPITDRHVLDELENEGILVWTPSRRVGGRRVICYDDRYILKTAVDKEAVIVSNDEYRDLIEESPDFKRVVEERLLMYSFVDGKFMPPDDPLGKRGPNLSQFLCKSSSQNAYGPPCPYGRKCTYGNKCKYSHPERAGGPVRSVTERLQEHALAHKRISPVNSWNPSTGSADGGKLKIAATRSHSLNPQLIASAGVKSETTSDIFVPTTSQNQKNSLSVYGSPQSISILSPHIDNINSHCLSTNVIGRHNVIGRLQSEAVIGQSVHSLLSKTWSNPEQAKHNSGGRSCPSTAVFAAENLLYLSSSDSNNGGPSVVRDRIFGRSLSPHESFVGAGTATGVSDPFVSMCGRSYMRQTNSAPLSHDSSTEFGGSRTSTIDADVFAEGPLVDTSRLHVGYKQQPHQGAGHHSAVTRYSSAPGVVDLANHLHSRKSSISDTQLNVWGRPLELSSSVGGSHTSLLSCTADTAGAVVDSGGNYYMPSTTLWGPLENCVQPLLYSSIASSSTRAVVSPTKSNTSNFYETHAHPISNWNPSRQRVYFHLSGIFSEAVVSAVMNDFPDVINPQDLCKLVCDRLAEKASSSLGKAAANSSMMDPGAETEY